MIQKREKDNYVKRKVERERDDWTEKEREREYTLFIEHILVVAASDGPLTHIPFKETFRAKLSQSQSQCLNEVKDGEKQRERKKDVCERVCVCARVCVREREREIKTMCENDYDIF